MGCFIDCPECGGYEPTHRCMSDECPCGYEPCQTCGGSGEVLDECCECIHCTYLDGEMKPAKRAERQEMRGVA